MNWIFLAIMAATFFGIKNVFVKTSSGHIDQVVGSVILTLAALLSGIIVLILKMKNSSLELEISQKGVWLAVLAGVSVGLAGIASFYTFSKGASASVGIPIIMGGSIVVGVIFGLLS